MKRLIKYWNLFQSDNAGFSEHSTSYEVLPELVEDGAGFPELRALAKKHAVKLGRKKYNGADGRAYDRHNVTHAINTTESHKRNYFGKLEQHPIFFGFVTIQDGPLKLVVKPGQKVTLEDARAIFEGQNYGVSDVGETIQGKTVLVMASHYYGHSIKFSGYSLESFEKQIGVDEHGFDDDTFSCSQCGKFDSSDSGYTYNHRIVAGDCLGVNCGCYQEYCESDEAIDHYTNNSGEAMEKESADGLEEAGKLKHVERFIGGMTDGRGGYFGGESTREGTPFKVLAEYQAKFPKVNFVFSHDESGQFQTYFSIYRVLKSKRKAA